MSNNPGRPTLHIDPFFDGEGGPQQQVALPDYGDELAGRQITLAPAAPRATSPNVRGTTTAGVDNVAGYRDVREMALSDGRPMAAVMRSGPTGLGGTVIPHAGLGGVPQGVHVHDTNSLEVNIDPHIEGGRSRVRLQDVQRNIAEAQEMAAEVTPEPYNIETLRLRGAATMHGVAQLANQQYEAAGQQGVQYRDEPATTAPQPAGNIPAPNQAQWTGQGATPAHGGGMGMPTAAPNPHRQVRPLQVFNQQPQATEPAREMRPIDLSQSPRPPERTLSPECEVTYEIEQFGSHTANYHDVVLGNGFIVLVYDTNYPGHMYAPPAAENAPPMAIAIAGHGSVYLVHSTGIQYAYGNQEFCILLIEREAAQQ